MLYMFDNARVPLHALPRLVGQRSQGHNTHAKLLFPNLLPFRPVTQFPEGNNGTLAGLYDEPNHSSDPLKPLLAAWETNPRSLGDRRYDVVNGFAL
jgi:hypothetical protein